MFIFADADLKFDQPQAEVVFDRDKLRSQGVDLSQAGRDLSVLLGGDYVNRFSIQGRSYKVIPQIERAERLTPDQLSQIYITGSGDKLVPLSTFASLKTTAEPRELKKFQQLNAVRVQGVIPPPVPLDTALGFLENEARAMLPAGFTIDYAGESRQLRTEGGRFLATFLLSAILIYLVLAAQFESFRDPFIILAGSVPLAVSGALLFSFLGLTTLNIYSQVGLITLVGLIAKNGILIVQFANHLQETGKEKLAAIVEAAGTRLRPILMTTAATVVGHFPLVIATGPGAGARNSIGIMLVSGMIIGTLFTLFVVPSIYMLRGAKRGTRSLRGGCRARDRRRPRFAGRSSSMNASELTPEQSIVSVLAVSLLLHSDTAAAQANSLSRRCSLTLDEAVRRAVENNPELAIVRLDTEVEAARVGESRARSAGVLDTTRTVERRHAAVEPAARRSRRGRRRLVLVDRRAPAAALGLRDMERLVGYARERRRTTRSPASIPACSRAFSWRSRSRCSGTARSTPRGSSTRSPSGTRRAPIFGSAKRSCRPSPPSSRRTGRSRRRGRTSPCSSDRSSWRRSWRGRTRCSVDAGQIPPLDLVQAQAEVAQRRENLIRANTVAEDAEDALRRLIVDPADVVVLAAAARTRRGADAPSRRFPTWMRQSQRRSNDRYDLARAGHELENARTTVDFLNNQRLPDVRLETSYRGNGLGGTQFLRTGGFPGLVTGTRSRGFGDALGQVFTNDYPTWSFGVTVSYPLGRSFEDASFARADVERRQAAQRDREPACAGGRDASAGPAGRFTARRSEWTRLARARRWPRSACSRSSADSRSGCRRRFS